MSDIRRLCSCISLFSWLLSSNLLMPTAPHHFSGRWRGAAMLSCSHRDSPLTMQVG